MNNYRQSTAEALGIKKSLSITWSEYHIVDGNHEIWQPDKDANQMLMVWEWLKKQGLKVELREIMWAYAEIDISLFTATEKAWEEYNHN